MLACMPNPSSMAQAYCAELSRLLTAQVLLECLPFMSWGGSFHMASIFHRRVPSLLQEGSSLSKYVLFVAYIHALLSSMGAMVACNLLPQPAWSVQQ